MNKVAVITRTKDRNITLKRTLQTLSSQVFNDFLWVIVNDGGIQDAVNKIEDEARKKIIETKVIHNEESLGMEASSNIGLRESDSKYVVILDDDDTWHPDFLSRTVSFLEDRKNDIYSGVVTRTIIIEELIRNESIREKRSYPWNEELVSITLMSLSKKNIPNMSFLYRRDVLDKIGFYREDYPVLGDWEFNLRFIRHFNIGVIPKYLAYYHKRPKSGPKYSNTGVHEHTVQRSLLANELLRQDLNNNTIGMGLVFNTALELKEITYRLEHREFFLIKKILKYLKSWI